MSVSTAQATDVAQALASMLESVEGLRVSWFVNDTARPPIAVIMQPSIDWTDSRGGFCRAAWTFPITIIVSRNNDREAQEALSRLVRDVATALDDTNPPDGVFSVEPQSARPLAVTVNGQELPGYELSVLIRA